MKTLSKLAYVSLKLRLKSHYHEPYIQKRGSTYGSWLYCSCPEHLPHKTLSLSAGVGEDISFDTELIHEHSVKVILIDPVLRAATHVESFLKNKQIKLSKNYSEKGRREISEYICTRKIQAAIRFEPYALWGKREKVGLVPPKSDKFVSYSRINLNKKANLIFFDGVDISTILKQNKTFISDYKFNFIKLDIEACELDFLVNDPEWRQCLQVLVEFDAFRNLNFRNYIKFIAIIKLFKKNHYILSRVDGYNTLWLKDI